MTVPKMPKMPVFKQPDKHQTKAAFNRQIRQIIVKLRDILPKSADKEMMARYLGVIYPGKQVDVTRLPFDTKNGTTKAQGLVSCLCAKMSYLILWYWDYYLDKSNNVQEINKLLADLEQVALKGLANCRVEGDMKNGFRLEVK